MHIDTPLKTNIFLLFPKRAQKLLKNAKKLQRGLGGYNNPLWTKCHPMRFKNLYSETIVGGKNYCWGKKEEKNISPFPAYICIDKLTCVSLYFFFLILHLFLLIFVWFSPKSKRNQVTIEKKKKRKTCWYVPHFAFLSEKRNGH